MLLGVWELDRRELGVGQVLLRDSRERLEAEAAERLEHEGMADAVHRGVDELDWWGVDGGSVKGLLVRYQGSKVKLKREWERCNQRNTDCTIFNKLSKYASFICCVTSTQSAELARPWTFQVVGSKCCAIEAEMPVSCGAMIWTAFSQ